MAASGYDRLDHILQNQERDRLEREAGQLTLHELGRVQDAAAEAISSLKVLTASLCSRVGTLVEESHAARVLIADLRREVVSRGPQSLQGATGASLEPLVEPGNYSYHDNALSNIGRVVAVDLAATSFGGGPDERSRQLHPGDAFASRVGGAVGSGSVPERSGGNNGPPGPGGRPPRR